MIEIDTRHRIRQTAHDLVMKYGIRSVSMDDIAAALGISKKTIYQFYVDKDQLVLEVVTEVIKKNEADCERDKKNAENAIHEIFLAMEMVVELFNKMNPSILFDMQKYHPGTFQHFQKHKNEYVYNVLNQNITRGIKEELYRPELNVDIISRFRVESMMLPFNPDFQKSLKYSLLKIEEELIIHFLFGLVSPRGYDLTLQYQQNRIKKQ